MLTVCCPALYKVQNTLCKTDSTFFRMCFNWVSFLPTFEHIWTFSSSHFQNKLVTFNAFKRDYQLLLSLVMHAAFPTSQDWFQPIRCVSVSNLHGLDVPIFTVCCCSGRFTNSKCGYLTSWEWDSTINYLCGAFRNIWDKSYWFYL